MSKLTTESGHIEVRTARLELKLYPRERAAVDRVALAKGHRNASDYARSLLAQDIARHDQQNGRRP